MRILLVAAALAVLAGTADAGPAKSAKPAAKPAAEQNWIAVCRGEDAQYIQTIGGAGSFHVSNGNHTYDTQRVIQSFYDGNVVCAIPDAKAPRANSDIAEICADKINDVISVLYRRETKTKAVVPKNALPFCQAHIEVMQ